MDQLTELRPPDFTDVTKWWIFSNKSLLVCLGGGVIAYLLFKITAMIHLAFLGVWLGVMLEAGLFTGVLFRSPILAVPCWHLVDVLPMSSLSV